MSIYRQIHVHMWQDEWVLDLEPDEKLLFIYLFSNSHTRLSGLYEIARKVIAFETGLSQERIETTLQKFHAAGKVRCYKSWVFVVNFMEYNGTTSPTVAKAIHSELADTPDMPIKAEWIQYHTPDRPPDTVSIPYTHGMDTVGVSERETVTDTVLTTDSLPANSTKHNDYIDDVLAHSQKPQHPGIADPSQDPSLWLQFRKEAIVIYQQQSGLHVIAPANQKAISDLAAEEHFDPERWRKSVESCIRGSVKPANVDCMIDTYHAGGDYKAMQDKRRNGRNDRHNQPSHGLHGLAEHKIADKAEYEAARAERLRRQALQDSAGHGEGSPLPNVRDAP